MINSDIEACKWLALSLNNLYRAMKMDKDGDYPSSVFFFQQSLEFYIKSLIVFANAEPKRSHDPGRQLQNLINGGQIDKSIQFIIELSAELSQEYLNTRYPGDESPWDIYDKHYLKELKKNVLAAFRDYKSVLKTVVPERKINLSGCLVKSVSNKQLKDIVEEMMQYLE